MLQETHAIMMDHDKWSKEWDGNIFYSDGPSNSRGVATLIPKELINSFELIETKADNNGRYLLIYCKIFNSELVLINTYGPTKDNPSAQTNLYSNLYEIVDSYSDKNIIIGGDLNTYLNIKLHKK